MFPRLFVFILSISVHLRYISTKECALLITCLKAVKDLNKATNKSHKIESYQIFCNLQTV